MTKAQSEILARLRISKARRDQADEDLDHYLRAGRELGLTLRELGERAGLSAEGVRLRLASDRAAK